VRIEGSYPPPLVRPACPQADDTAGPGIGLVAVTRYDRSRPHTPGTARRGTTRAWTATSLALAAAGAAAVVLLPQGGAGPARLDVPMAASAPVTATWPGSPPGEVAAQPAAVRLPASQPVRVEIPALGVASRVMELGLEQDGSMEVPPGAYPVGWYDGSPTPGELGPAVLAGHVDWGGEPGAFYGLRELLAGDEVVVERADGTVVTFRVERVEEHAKDDFPSDDVYGDIGHAGLRLITCGGSFDTDTGDYTDNVIVFADLVTGG